MTRDEIRSEIDRLERLHDIERAIEDVAGIEWEPHDRRLVKLLIQDYDTSRPVAFALGIPPEVLLIGLRAMKQALEALKTAEQQTEEAHG